MKYKMILMSMFFLTGCSSFSVHWVEASGTHNPNPEEVESSAYITHFSPFYGLVTHAAVNQNWWVTEHRNPFGLSGNPSWLPVLAVVGSGLRTSTPYSEIWAIDPSIDVSWSLHAVWKRKAGVQSWTAWNGGEYLGEVSRQGVDWEFVGWKVKHTPVPQPSPSDPPLND